MSQSFRIMSTLPFMKQRTSWVCRVIPTDSFGIRSRSIHVRQDRSRPLRWNVSMELRGRWRSPIVIHCNSAQRIMDSGMQRLSPRRFEQLWEISSIVKILRVPSLRINQLVLIHVRGIIGMNDCFIQSRFQELYHPPQLSLVHSVSIVFVSSALNFVTHMDAMARKNSFLHHLMALSFLFVALALMEDSGWYAANYSKSKISPWGHNAGCSFVHEPCLIQQDGETIVPDYGKGYFCTKNCEFSTWTAVQQKKEILLRSNLTSSNCSFAAIWIKKKKTLP